MEDDFFYMIAIMLSQSSCVSPPSLFLCLQQPSGVQRQCLLLGGVSAGETQRIGLPGFTEPSFYWILYILGLSN